MRREFQLIEVEDDLTEPVSLSEQKAYSQIDEEYSVKDSQISILITSARQLLEAQTNVGFIKRNVQLEWTGVCMSLPLSPTGEIVSVKDKDGVDVPTDDYSVSRYTSKKIAIKTASEENLNYWYSRSGYVEVTGFPQWRSLEDFPFYACVYNTGYEVLPSSLKSAIMAQTDYMLKQIGMPDRDVNQISPEALMLVRSYSRNLVL